MQLNDFECPNCGGHDMETAEDQRLMCRFCGSAFGEVTRICPKCGHYNDENVRHCSKCGTRIVRECPACGADNWTLADHCVQCGRNLDLIDQMAQRWQQTTEERLYERRAAMTSLKEQEERASQERMAALMEAERTRQEALALARESQRQRERQLYVWAGVALLVFVVLAVLMLLLTSGGG
jgi:uncharacterized membrane protein YvbJ